jgi:hypothetical protein
MGTLRNVHLCVCKVLFIPKIAGFWVITQKPLIISEILNGVKMISTARSTYSAILK